MAELISIKSITEAHDLLGLEKPGHPLVSVFRHNKETFRNYSGDIRVVLDLYLVSLKDGISGSLGYGRNSYDFHEGTMIFTSPGQVLTPEENENLDNFGGWTLLLHPDLLRKSELGNTIDDYSFFSYDVHEALHVSDDEKRTLTQILEKIENEYNQNIDKHSQNLIVSNIKLLLDYCTRYYDRQFYTRTNLNKDVVTKFELLLKDYYRSDKPLELGLPTVKFCGAELGLSPNYLSDLLKKLSGRNAQEQIHFFLIDKAKTKLLNSTAAISRIAYDLGFDYPQHFSKMFKSKTGMSPAEFRSLN